MNPSESVELIVTVKKPRGKSARVFASTAELKRRVEACERACDVRFEVLLHAINQLMRPKVTPKIRRRRRAQN
jgi:hypothetical protein